MAEAADVAVEPTKDKSCVLKASIHCEGCKRKVKKILTQVQGVDFVDIDTKQQKVTVFGTADPDTLIQKLFKSGKHAQLWPQKASGNSKIKEEKSTTEKQTKVAHPQQEANPTSNNVPKVQLPATAKIGGGGSATKTQEIGGEDKNDVVQETKSEGKKKDEGFSDGRETPQAVEKSNVGGGGEPSCSTTSSGKKKKKKGQNSNINASAVSGPAAPVVTDNHESGPPVGTNQSPPRHHHNLPQHHHYYYTPPPQPAYGVSYNTAYPTSSYTASYYPPPPHSFAYAYPGQPPLDQDHSIPPQPLDSFEMFSDENPNGCNIV